MRSLHLLTLFGSSLLLAAACSSSNITGGLAEGVGAGTGTGASSNGAGASGVATSGSPASSTTSFATSTTSSGTGGTTTSSGNPTSSGTGGASGTSSTSGTGGSSTSSGGTGGASATSSGTSTTTSSGTSSSAASSSSSAASSSSGGPVTIGQMCNNVPTQLTGTVYAPNGVDPIPNVRVYALATLDHKPIAYPANYCDKCSTPIDPAYDETTSAADGTFTLVLDDVPDVPAGAPVVYFALQIGRFRKVTPITITPCTTGQVPKPDETLPGNSMAGDIPKIAVAMGNKDHLDQVLTNLGITEWDCYEGRTSTTNPTCTAPTNPSTNQPYTIADLLNNTDPTKGKAITSYHMAFVSCAPGGYNKYVTQAGIQTNVTTNTVNWVNNPNGGGRLFVTDTSYDYIGQAFPQAITWEGAAGSPQPVDGANLGCSPPNNTSGPPTPYNIKIDDPTLAAWLKVLNPPFTTSPNVQVNGFYEPWSAMASVPMTTTTIADGTMPLDLTDPITKACPSTNPPTYAMQDVPLTVEFNSGTCGRVLYSAYHTYNGTGTGMANEKIMEYMIFAAATCRQ